MSEEKKGYKVLQWSIVNARKIALFELDNIKEAGMIKIKGKNKQGKSTIIDTAEILFKGARQLPNDFVRHGEDEFETTMTIGEWTIKKVFRKDGSQKHFSVKHDKGYSADAPQRFLKDMVNNLTFNPKPFENKTPAQKWRFLIDTFGLNYDEIDALIKENETERTFIGRQIDEIGRLIEPDKVEYIDIKEKESFNKQQQERQNKIDQAKNKLEVIQGELSVIDNEINELEEKLRKSKEKRIEIKSRVDAGEKYIVSLPRPEKHEDLTAAIENNKKYDVYEKWKKDKAAKDKLQAQYDSYTEKIEADRQSKKDELKQLKIIPGLEIRDEGVYYNNIHCDNWSDSETEVISAKICRALKPELNAMFLDGADKYDSDSLAELDKWAIEEGIQLFVTIVEKPDLDNLDDDAIYIVDGNILNQEK